MKKIMMALAGLFLGSCTSVPENVTPVSGFEVSRYLGKWYEIARLDHGFEKGLSQVTATYSMGEEEEIKVVNRGFEREEGSWDEATGKAYFVAEPDIGHLKVSFFGPFYSSYVIFALDKQNYEYAMVTGPDKSYLWILSRTPQLDPIIVKRLVSKAQSLGFSTADLNYVDQTLSGVEKNQS